jgi:cobalt/nickel transport protein
MRNLFLMTLTALGLSAAPASAHYNMLLPSTWSAKKGEVVTFTYQWGHPFEHQLFNAPAPESVAVLAPDGKTVTPIKDLEKVALPAGEGKTVTAYQFRFTPGERGDYVSLLRTAPIWMEEDGEFLQDTVKVVLHVQAQKGWDGIQSRDFEFQPLTRPYGLRPGMGFQARIEEGSESKARPLASALVEVERYNATPPKELPPDEQITRTVKTDPNGVATTTLTEAGWWCLTVARDGGKREREGKRYPLRQRSILWVFVDEKAPAQRTGE